MSDDPTDRILVAIAGLGLRLGRLEGLDARLERLEGLDARLERLEGLDARLERLEGQMGRLRIDLMARMDRLQDTQTEQRDSMDVLLDLLVSNQRMAERSLSEARLGVDLQSRMTTTIATLERQVRRLQEDVRHLKGES
jgi:hypothetical protein